MRRYCLLLLLFFYCYHLSGQNTAAYKNANLPVEQRVQDLLQRMTPEEKFRQLFMIAHDSKFDSVQYRSGIFGLELSADTKIATAAQQLINNNAETDAVGTIQQLNTIQSYLVNQTRLGIPALFFGEALHGLVAKNATVFPQSIALAASFDTSLMHCVAESIALETQQRGIRQVLSPVVNIASDVRWGRVEETYGEDPFLSAEMGVAFVQEFEKRNIITTPKHFVANVGDGGRDSYPIHVDERTLNDLYLYPFKACILRGGSRSIMSSYNSLNGTACSMNSDLLQKKLKQEWQFKGYVISDAGAVGGANVLHHTSVDYPNSGKLAIENGMDVIFQTAIQHDQLFNLYFLNGKVSSAAIDSAVARVLRIKFTLGLFEHPYASLTAIAKEKHKALAKQAAIESMVLLKNKNKLLPLSKSIKSIAVIGRDAVDCRLGGYSGVSANPVNLVEGLKTHCAPTTKITYSEGVGRSFSNFTTIPTEVLFIDSFTHGVQSKYFSNITLKAPAAVERNESILDFYYTFYSPDPKISSDYFSAVFTTQLKAPKSGNYQIGLAGNDGYRLYIDGKLVIDGWQKTGFHQQTVAFDFVQYKRYALRIEFYESVGNAQLKLIWNMQTQNEEQVKMEEAINRAKQAEVILFYGGIEEGEFQDRKSLRLQGFQEQLLLQLAALHKPMIVLLSGGSAVNMANWIDSVDAVLETWYGGEQQGNAIAELLLGEQNPSGKLPITFPMSEGQLPLVYNHQPTGRGDDYIDGSGHPLFPFGFGLSYTTFEYNNIHLDKAVLHSDETVTIEFEMKNTGTVDGVEVVELYINQPVAELTQPVIALKQFKRVALKAGEQKVVQLQLAAAALVHSNSSNQDVLEKGEYYIKIGSSSRNLPLKAVIKVE